MAILPDINISSNLCYHCGEICDSSLQIAKKTFCCIGCQQIYLLLQENSLCNYYSIDKNPGLKAKGKFISERFAYLDDESVIAKLVQYRSAVQMNITFSLPQIHCSSCVFLLENLHKMDSGIINSTTNFQRKEVFIVFDPRAITLRKVVELLAFIGYEPRISLNDTVEKKANLYNRSQIYKIGVAGFCFSNIMMLSFPEYFSGGNIEQPGLKQVFTILNFLLSLPVLIFSARDIFVSAFKGIREKFLNIDAPIALAIVVTFARSYYEIFSDRGSGYLDSGTGIIFFMLIGRWFQTNTYNSLSFDRDYRSYFPLGVTVLKEGVESNMPITLLKIGDRILLRNQEMIPADAILVAGAANIDYSFVSGENTPVIKKIGELLYAGGKQIGAALELRIVKEPAQSYITKLWNNDVFSHKKNTENSFIHPWSRYFSIGLFSVALITGVFWWFVDSVKVLPAVTAVLIVACPCSLLLSSTFTYGNMLRIFGRNKFFLKNSSVIESLAKIDSIVFDKTGTITENQATVVRYAGDLLSKQHEAIVKIAAKQSSHPLSQTIASFLPDIGFHKSSILNFKETAGEGIEAVIDDVVVKLGSPSFVGIVSEKTLNYSGASIHVAVDNAYQGEYFIENKYREGLSIMILSLRKKGYRLSILSGDNDNERKRLREMFGRSSRFEFRRSPFQKLDYVSRLQQNKRRVLMLGDGLNDAGALMQSDVGIAVSDNTTQFSPACDAILDGGKVRDLDKFIAFARSGREIVMASFILSILYNIVGLSFAVRGTLSPVVAAILMPASSISIVLFVSLLSSASARFKGL